MTNVASLPKDVQLNCIFPPLEPLELTRCCQVCKQWNELASDESLWKEIARRTFGGIPIAQKVKGVLKNIPLRHVKSNDEILERLKAFIGRVNLDQNSRFRCILHIDKYLFEGLMPHVINVAIIGRRNGTPVNIFDNRAVDLVSFDYKVDYYALHSIGENSLKTSRTFFAARLRDAIHGASNYGSTCLSITGRDRLEVVRGLPREKSNLNLEDRFVDIEKVACSVVDRKRAAMLVVRTSTDGAMCAKLSIIVALVACAFYLTLTQYLNPTTPQID